MQKQQKINQYLIHWVIKNDPSCARGTENKRHKTSNSFGQTPHRYNLKCSEGTPRARDGEGVPERGWRTFFRLAFWAWESGGNERDKILRHRKPRGLQSIQGKKITTEMLREIWCRGRKGINIWNILTWGMSISGASRVQRWKCYVRSWTPLSCVQYQTKVVSGRFSAGIAAYNTLWKPSGVVSMPQRTGKFKNKFIFVC